MPLDRWLPQTTRWKQRVRIVLVDPSTRRIDALLRDNSVIQVAVWETDPLFRWPVDGEIWTIQQESGVWMLGARQDNPIEDTSVSDMAPGDVRIHSTTANVQVTTGSQTFSVPLKYIETFGDGTTTIFTFQHNLNTLDTHYSVRTIGQPYTSILEGTQYTITARDLNDITVSFSVAPPVNGYSITIMG